LAEPVRHAQGMVAAGSGRGRPPAWVVIGLLVLCLALSVAGGLRGHISTAVWFAVLAVASGWILIRRRTADRQPPGDLAQMRRRAILTELGIAGSGVAIGALFLERSVWTSGGDLVRQCPTRSRIVRSRRVDLHCGLALRQKKLGPSRGQRVGVGCSVSRKSAATLTPNPYLQRQSTTRPLGSDARSRD